MRTITGPVGRRAWSVALLLASVLGLTASALGQNDKSDPLCPHIVACQYEAPAFSIRVVDQQTGQPLADVLTAERAGELLAPYITTLPPFDDSLLPSCTQST